MSAADPPRDATPPLAFHPHRIVIGGGVLAAFAGLSLSFVTSGSGGRPWSLLDGVVLLAMLTPLALLTMVPDRGRPLPQGRRAIATALVLLATPYAVVKVLEAATLARALGGSVGPGPWLVVGGIVGTVAGVALGWVRPGEPMDPPPPAARRRGRAEMEPTTPAASGDEEAWRSVSGEETSWLDENPFGEPLFDSLELEVPRERDGAASAPPYDQESEDPDEPGGGFDADAEPHPGTEDRGPKER